MTMRIRNASLIKPVSVSIALVAILNSLNSIQPLQAAQVILSDPDQQANPSELAQICEPFSDLERLPLPLQALDLAPLDRLAVSPLEACKRQQLLSQTCPQAQLFRQFPRQTLPDKLDHTVQTLEHRARNAKLALESPSTVSGPQALKDFPDVQLRPGPTLLASNSRGEADLVADHASIAQRSPVENPSVSPEATAPPAIAGSDLADLSSCVLGGVPPTGGPIAAAGFPFLALTGLVPAATVPFLIPDGSPPGGPPGAIVPEPATILATGVALGFAGLFWQRRSRTRKH